MRLVSTSSKAATRLAIALAAVKVALDTQRQPCVRAAVRWLKRAAASGAPVAWLLLGRICHPSKGLSPDARRAFHWYYRAACLGSGEAQEVIANAYLYGH